jgi:diguanylate cyclase (GGDEF)-like protein/PAS domain S-box-containing protein
MPRLSPHGLWRIYQSVAALIIVAAWVVALVHTNTPGPTGKDGTAAGDNAYLSAALLTLLLAATLLVVRNASHQLQTTHRALRKEIRRSRKVFESMKEGVLLLDLEGRISFANVAARAWLPDARGHRFTSVIAKAGLALTNEDGSALADTDPIRSFCIKRGCDLDGVWLTRADDHDAAWLEVSIKVVRDENEIVSGATLTITDRSEEHDRLTESALSESILANMHEAVMITDAQGIIVRINPAFTRITGYASEEVLGRTPRVLRSSQHDAEFHSTFWQQLKREGHWSGRYWNRRKSGEEYCSSQTVTSVCDTRGQVVRYITVSRDITDQKIRENELWQRANFDPLTGLANRTRFADRVAQALVHAHRHGNTFALCYLDLDHFKPVNDTLGHAAGDELLRQVAQRMNAVLREEDLLARIGGDEFALLLTQLPEMGDAAYVAGKLVDSISKPFELLEGVASIGISIGIAQYPGDGDSEETLTAAADRALYFAKAGGRNRWHHAGKATSPGPLTH